MPQSAVRLNETKTVACLPQADIILPGRYSLTSRRNFRGERRIFACHTLYISSEMISLVAPVSGYMGERVIATFAELGKLEGKIVRRFGNGFEMRLTLATSQRKLLTAKIDWLQQHKRHRVRDMRFHPRTVPSDPHSTVLLADGSVSSCIVIDMSVSGAAVSAEHSPKLGEVLAVGKIVGRVARLFSGGFAIQFVELQDRDTLERLLISRECRASSVGPP